MFDGKSVMKRQPTQDELIAEASDAKDEQMSSASTAISTLQDSVEFGRATEAEAALLPEWRKYRVTLNRVDPSKAPDIEWPEIPA